MPLSASQKEQVEDILYHFTLRKNGGWPIFLDLRTNPENVCKVALECIKKNPRLTLSFSRDLTISRKTRKTKQPKTKGPK